MMWQKICKVDHSQTQRGTYHSKGGKNWIRKGDTVYTDTDITKLTKILSFSRSCHPEGEAQKIIRH